MPQGYSPLLLRRRVRQIKDLVPAILIKWGLLPKFKRWRLAKDPEMGLVVLFGVLDVQYIGENTTIPFSDYFDTRLLNDLTDDLQVKVFSSERDGLRYAFVLEDGDLNLPTQNLEESSLHPALYPSEATSFH